MVAPDNAKLREYREFIEIIAKVEYQKFANSHLIEIPELINIGTHALYILFKNKPPEYYNNTYLSTAIKWAIRNEVRRRFKWYTLKNNKKEEVTTSENEGDENIELRIDLYKSILSIDQMQEAECPTQIKSKERSPEESAELHEIKEEILKAMKKIPERERELIESKFFKDKKLREISQEFNLSPSRISRIIQSGLDRIKKDLSKHGVT